jgi:hypothetical protein
LKRAQWGAGIDPDMRADIAMDAAVRERPTRGGMDDHGALGTDKISF